MEGFGMTSDLSRTGAVERDIEQAITALKKGAYLLKYGRRGKPKFCPFRLSNDESVLIWFSGKEEKHLKLSHVSRIISGQRTPIFQRYPRPEKEYQSFSLIYNDRSLDLICKDKDEAEVWFSGLKALISRSHHRKWRTESRSDGIPSEANSPRTYTRRSSPMNSPFGSNESLQKDSGDHLRLHSPYDSPPKNGLDKALSDVMLYAVPPKGFFPPDSASASVHSVSSGGSDSMHGHMKTMGMDAFRVSLSSAVSSSSQGSGHDDGDALGDVFIWGEGTGDGVLGGGTHRVGSSLGVKMDSLFPKALESAVVLDVQNIACGGRHAALVTKQGEIFSWGEESGGRLGHGVDSDVLHPKLIETLSNTNIELVACGEYHTCAVTLSGDLYTWGDGTYNYGLLGHGNQVSHWVPKRVNGPLEGIHVSSISCGPWHTAVVTSAGQLFTFGDGTFGVLGHGDRKSVSLPREVESLKGLRTVRAACGVWHTAAVVEVMVGNSSSSNCSSGKLFTWGDGDKGRLGHGDKEAKLVPTCVAALVEPNFCQEVIKLRQQVENLTRKAQLQEVELERTTKQLKDAIAIAGEETAKCKAAKEVIKSLTAQLKDMAERLPVGAARNVKSPSLASIGSNELSYASIDRLNIQATSPEADLTGSNNQLLSNGSSTASNRSSAGHNKQNQSEVTNKNGSRTKESESRSENEWVEQDEPGVYITLTSLPGGVIDLKRVRFSRKRFSEKQAEQWWAENRARVYEQYNVRMIDKSSVGVGSEDLAH
ncbi:putative E3 ubiquitin-protein ligase [Arachis hypogaea]|nr:putative E3 ubiquitin-protein ligase [Arachis hypogaea]